MQPNAHWLSGEASLDEMLADPIVRTLMARDGLDEEAVRRACREAVRRLRSGRQGIDEAA